MTDHITTAFAAKRNLVTLLRSLVDPVYYGHPGREVPDYSEWVWVGEVEWDSDEPEAVGRATSNEVYRIIITLEAHVPADNQEEANARVENRMYIIQNALAVGPGNVNPLGISNPISVRIEPQFLGEGNNAGSGRGAILVLSLRVEARK